MIFRAIWPITDETTPWAELIAQATDDLPELARRAHARILRAGRFSVARSADVPGSGRVTESVLMFEAPAAEIPRRAYWKAAA